MITLQSIFLLGLLGLLLPIIIHLWSRKKSTPIPFGSIRFIQASSQRALRKISPTDLWLFLLRCLLIISLVAILSDVRLETIQSTPVTRLWVDSSYLKTEQFSIPLKTASDTAIIMGLPTEENDPAILTLKQQVAQQDHVLLPLSISDIGERIDTWTSYKIQMLPAATENKKLGIGKIGKSPVMYSGQFDEKRSLISIETTVEGPTISVTYYLEADPANESITAIVQAMIRTINEKGNYQLVSATTPEDADVVFWFNQNKSPVWMNQLVLLQGQSNPIDIWNEKVAVISKSLDKKSALESRLLHQLYDWMSPINQQMKVMDQRVPPQLMAHLSYKEQPLVKRPSDLRYLWWLVLLVCIGIERWLTVK